MTGWSGSASLNPGDTVYFRNTDTWSDYNQGSDYGVVYAVGGVTYDGETWGEGSKAVITLSSDAAAIFMLNEDDDTYETVIKGFELTAGTSYLASGVQINYSGGGTVNLTGATKRIQNCYIHHVGKSNQSYACYGIKIGGHNHDTHNVDIISNRVHDTGRTAITVYPSDSYSNVVGNVLICDNVVSNSGLVESSGGFGIGLKNTAEDVTIEHNYMSGCNGPAIGFGSDGTSYSGPTNIIVRYNVAHNNKDCGFYDHSPSASVRQYDVYGNLFSSNERYGIRVTNPSTDITARFYNNTFFGNCTDYGSGEVYFDGDWSGSPNIEFINNIIYSTTAGVTPLRDIDGGLLTHSNNLYYREGGGNVVDDGGSTYTAATLTNYESTAQSGDPLFADTNSLPTNVTSTAGVSPDGLKPQQGSPAINNGTNGLALVDIDGTVFPSSEPRDIGAYETYNAPYLTSMTIGTNLTTITVRGSVGWHPYPEYRTNLLAGNWTQMATNTFTSTYPVLADEQYSLTWTNLIYDNAYYRTVASNENGMAEGSIPE